MQQIKKLCALALVAVLLVAAAACSASSGQQGESGQAGDSGQGAESSGGGVAPIKWLTTGDTGAKPLAQGDRIVAVINEQLGIDLEVQIVPEGNVEKVNVAMASGDFPDVVTGAYGTSATQQWIDNGMVIPLNSYFETNPNMQRVCQEEYGWTAVDGDFYGVPFITQFSKANALIAMRADWLENLGLDYPETLEDMKAVLTAFTFNDPDGNGQDDTYGFTADKPSSTTGGTPFDWVFYAYGREYGDYAVGPGGTLIPWFEEESFVLGMTYIKDLWDSGVVDNELFLNDTAKREEKFYQGKSGAMLGPMFRHVSRHEGSLRQVFPEASLTFGLPPKGPDGAYGLSMQGKDGMFTCITAACNAPDKAAALIDLFLSEEGNNLLRLGIEGIHYTAEGGSIVYNEEERAKDAFSDNGWAHPLAWGTFYWPLESGYLAENEPERDRALESIELATQAQRPNLIKQKTPLEIQSKASLNDIFIQYFSDILQGKVGIEEGQEQLSNEWRSQGGEELLAEVTEVYQAQN